MFYTEGSAELKKARMDLALYSLPNAAYRLEKSRRFRMESDRVEEDIKYLDYVDSFQKYGIVAT